MSQGKNNQNQRRPVTGTPGNGNQSPAISNTMVHRPQRNHNAASTNTTPSAGSHNPPSAKSHNPPSTHPPSTLNTSQSNPATMDAPSDPIDSCVFCKILRGDLPSTVIKEWEDAICIIPRDAVAPGHVLVLPKTHVANGEEDKKVTAKTVICAMDNPRQWMRKAMQHLQEPLPKKSDFAYNTQFSTGADATQTVFHLHIHLVPRVENDGLPLPWTGQQGGHYNTTEKRAIKPSICQGLPEEKKGVCCRRKHMMTKDEQQKLRRNLRA